MSSPSKSNKDRLQYAFDIAEKELGIAKLLDPEDVDVENPDEKSVMTYVAQFLHKYVCHLIYDPFNDIILCLCERMLN